MEKDNVFWQIILKALRSLRSLVSDCYFKKSLIYGFKFSNNLVDIFYVFLK